MVVFIVAEAELDVPGCGVQFGGRDDGGCFGAALTEYDLGFVGDEACPAGFAVVGCGFGRGGGGEVEGYIEAGEGVVELVGLHGDGIRMHLGVRG